MACHRFHLPLLLRSLVLLLALLSTAATASPMTASAIDPVEQAIVHDVRQTLGITDNNNSSSRLLRGSSNLLWERASPSVMRANDHNTRNEQVKKQIQLGCAWSATVTAATYNIAFPDLNCVYQVLLYWGVTGKTTLRIDGKFPRVRYFSFQTYDLQSGEPIASLIDYEIDATTGTNPFKEEPRHGDKNVKDDAHATAVEEQEDFGSYQLHVTDTGNRGFPNELAAASGSAGRHRHRSCAEGGCLALVIMRLYTAEPGEDAFHHSSSQQHYHHPSNLPSFQYGRLWGYVPPPEVSVRYGEWVNQWTGKTVERYKVLEQCQQEKTTIVKNFLDWKLPQLKGDWEGQSQLDNIDDNFVVFTPSTSSRALFANADANYLFATARNNRTLLTATAPSLSTAMVAASAEGVGGAGQQPIRKKELVARITGRLPTVAHGFTRSTNQQKDFHVIADRDSYEARYVSLSTIALKGAGPVIDTVMDVAMEAKYRGNPDWQRERQFSVVAAPGTRLLALCPPRVYQEERDLFLKTLEREEGQPPAHLAFLYRQILSKWQTLGYKDQSIARAKYECLGKKDNGHACKLRSFFVDLMGPQYPSIKYFYCWKNETQGCSCEDSQGKEVEWEMEKEPEVVDEEEEWWNLPFSHHHHHHHHPHLDEDFAEYEYYFFNGATSLRGSDGGFDDDGDGKGEGNYTMSTSNNNISTIALSLDNNSTNKSPSLSWNQTQAYYYYYQQRQQQQQQQQQQQSVVAYSDFINKNQKKKEEKDEGNLLAATSDLPATTNESNNRRVLVDHNKDQHRAKENNN